ncbi:hypothetical protein G6F68_019914 [Rhizopus microsporus]|nr:hypothetical protein G6F68_019914 [Rhizopus microsporus]
MDVDQSQYIRFQLTVAAGLGGQSGQHGQHQQAVGDTLAEGRGAGVFVVDVQAVEVAGQAGEVDDIALGDGAAG